MKRAGWRRAAPRPRTLGAAAAALVFAVAPCTARAQTPTDSLLDQAARAVAASRTMVAAFEQTLTNPDIKQSKVSRGSFVQQGPARFAFRFTEPGGDAIVADGTALWIYLPSSARGQVLKMPIAQGAQLDLMTQLLTSPRTSYAITDGPAETLGGKPVVVVHLTPKLSTAPFVRATLWIDPETAVVQQLEATETSGLVRRIRFSDIRTDVALPAGALTFVVPGDAKVVDATGLLGARAPRSPR